MKKLFLISAISLFLASCGSGSTTENTATTDSTSVVVDSTAVVDTTAVDTTKTK